MMTAEYCTNDKCKIQKCDNCKEDEIEDPPDDFLIDENNSIA